MLLEKYKKKLIYISLILSGLIVSVILISTRVPGTIFLLDSIIFIFLLLFGCSIILTIIFIIIFVVSVFHKNNWKALIILFL